MPYARADPRPRKRRWGRRQIPVSGLAAVKSHNPFIVNDIVFGKETGFDAMAMRCCVRKLRSATLWWITPSYTWRCIPTAAPTFRLLGRPRREQNAVQQLVVLAVGRIQLSHGVLLLNDRVLPLNISASDVELFLSYVLPDKRYEGALKIGKFATQYKQWQPVTASAEATFSLSQRGALFKSLKVTSGQSVVQASGELRDWPAPKITASYVAQLDVPQLGLIASIPELRQGRVWLQGQGTADAAGFASTGQAYGSRIRLCQPQPSRDERGHCKRFLSYAR